MHTVLCLATTLGVGLGAVCNLRTEDNYSRVVFAQQSNNCYKSVQILKFTRIIKTTITVNQYKSTYIFETIKLIELHVLDVL